MASAVLPFSLAAITRLKSRPAASRGGMLERSGGWPVAGTAEDQGGPNGHGDSALLSRWNIDINATTSAMDAIPSAAHGTIFCAFQAARSAVPVREATQ